MLSSFLLSHCASILGINSIINPREHCSTSCRWLELRLKLLALRSKCERRCDALAKEILQPIASLFLLFFEWWEGMQLFALWIQKYPSDSAHSLSVMIFFLCVALISILPSAWLGLESWIPLEERGVHFVLRWAVCKTLAWSENPLLEV